MLHHPVRPTPASALAIEWALESLADAAELSDASEWQEVYPALARCFIPKLAAQALKAMLRHHRAPEVYEPTDYHWLLFEEAVAGQFDLMNDQGDEPGSYLHVLDRLVEPDSDFWFRRRAGGRFSADAGCFLDAYSPDADFTLDAALVDRLGPEWRSSMGFRKTTWAVVQGLVPHPSELTMPVVAAPGAWPKD